MTAVRRTPLLALALALLAGFLVAITQQAPAAHAGETSASKGNYVPLATPTRVLNKALGTNASADFTAVGVTNVPRTGTTAVVLTVTLTNTGANWGEVYIETNCATACSENSVESSLEGGKGPMSNTIVADIDPAKATNHLKARAYTYTTTTISVQVDVVGYYTTTSTGGGFVATRPVTLFDTRANGGAAIPAGGTTSRTLTGTSIPAGATSAYINLIATGITAAGTVVAVPTGTATTGYPALTFWAAASSRSGLVAVKLSAAGQVTFKNTSTKPVHLVARSEGYTTSSPSTGADLRPVTSELWQKSMTATKKIEIQIAGYAGSSIPANAAGVFVNLEIFAPKGGGSIRIYPSGQAASTASYINFTADGTYGRSSGAIVVPGEGGRITIEGAANGDFWMSLQTQAYFAAPTNYATAGGTPAFSVVHTSLGDCYGYLDPSASNVRVGCDPQDGTEPIYSLISPPGHTFRGPFSMVARPGGRYVVTALHAPDGEIWTWDLPYSAGAPPVTTAVRTYHYSRTPVATATLPDGAPVGFTTDGQGRFWAIDLSIAAPEQPRWKPLDIPVTASAPTGELTALSTSAGIRLFGVTSTGDVVTGLYAAATSTALGWQSLGTADVINRVAVALSESGEPRLAVRHGDGTVWSANLTAAGQTADGWHQVGTTYNGAAIDPSGSPTVVYDPQTQLNGVLVWSGSVGTGALYRVWETAPNSGDFAGPAGGISLETGGIASDVTAWDYRTETPLYRRWSFLYLDANYARKLATSYAA